MSKSTDTACPKCGSLMVIRLGEFVCRECGYFMTLKARDEYVESDGKVRPRQAAAPVYNSGRRGTVKYDNSHIAAGWRQIEKCILIFLLFASMSLGNYLLNPAFKTESIGEFSFRSLLVAGLLFAAFASLALFIDWRGFKRFVLGLICLATVFHMWLLYCVSQLATQLILYKLLADLFLLVWLANLLYREAARTR